MEKTTDAEGLCMQGLIHIYCGEGKGKTTAAVGLGVRACGSGMRVVLAQFLKGNSSGERRVLERLPGFFLIPGPESVKFTFQMTPREMEEARRQSGAMLRAAVETARRETCGLLILDEVFGAVSTGVLQAEDVLNFLRGKPEALEVVLTGRDPAPEFLQLADYVSEIRKIKHPYDRKVPARKGIEY